MGWLVTLADLLRRPIGLRDRYILKLAGDSERKIDRP
jgi:hypothetical protein